jgi:hypothetical protein
MTKDFGSKISFRTFGYCFGGLKGSDSFFEIYTESYGDRYCNSRSWSGSVTAEVLEIF